MSTKEMIMRPEEFFMDMFPIEEMEQCGIVTNEESKSEIWVAVKPDCGAVVHIVHQAGGIIDVPLITDLHFIRFTSKKRHDDMLEIAKAINNKDVDEALEICKGSGFNSVKVKLS